MNLRQGVLLASWVLAGFVVVSGGTVALVIPGIGTGSRVGYIAFVLAVAAMILLLIHQRLGLLSVSSMVLVAAGLTVPALLVHETPDTSGCQGLIRAPCDPGLNFHPAIRLSLLAVFWAAAFLTAVVGYIRFRRN